MRGVCVVARTGYERDAVREELASADLPVEVLEADSPDESSEGVRLATMHRVKGLEFDRMLIVSTNEDLVPLAAAVHDLGNEGGPERAAETAEPRAALRRSNPRQERAHGAELRLPEPVPALSVPT